mmetsp:Transcript_19730/g.27518  ORF Transcript_19730/g.27518 Transcript_19730/m.27518 type:complete len:264 (-) Transcript_19730:15-806(-)
MDVLMRKIDHIQKQCSVQALVNSNEKLIEKSRFMLLKKQIAQDVKAINKEIEERNELLSQSGNTVQRVKMSAAIRAHIKELGLKAEELQEMYEEELPKEKQDEYTQKKVVTDLMKTEDLRLKQEIVDLVFKHIEELKNLERGTTPSHNNRRDDKQPSLPDLDDPHFQTLLSYENEINRQLEEVNRGLQVLKALASGMTNEVEMQSQMIEELTVEVSKMNEILENLNIRMKKVLRALGGAERFGILFVLLVILLGLLASIYNLS